MCKQYFNTHFIPIHFSFILFYIKPINVYCDDQRLKLLKASKSLFLTGIFLPYLTNKNVYIWRSLWYYNNNRWPSQRNKTKCHVWYTTHDDILLDYKNVMGKSIYTIISCLNQRTLKTLTRFQKTTSVIDILD